MKNTRKISLLTLGFVFLFGYGFLVVQAAYPATQFEPGETLDPGLANPACTPGSANCSVSTAWDMDLTSGYIFNTTELVGIGTATPVVELDVVGGVNFLNTTADSLSTFVHGDTSLLGGAGSAGSYSFVSQEVFSVNTLGVQSLYIDNADNILARTFVRNAGVDLGFSMYTGDGDSGTLGTQTFIDFEAEDSNIGADSYFKLHTNGEINLNSNPDANISAALDFDDDGTVNLFSNTDIALGISSGITLNGPSALYPGSLSAFATNANDIGAYFALDPDVLTSIGVDDENDDGNYSMTLSPDYNTGITISHTDTTLGLVDVGTFYWGGLDAGSGSVINRVVTDAVASDDFMMNQWSLSGSGISYAYQSGTGATYGPQTSGISLNIDNDFAWIGDTASFDVGTGTLDLDADFAWIGDIATFDVTGGDLNLSNDLVWVGDSSSFDATRAVSDDDGIVNVNEFNTNLTTLATITDTSYRGLASILTYTGDDDMSGITAAASQPLVGILSQVGNTGLGNVGMQGLLVTTSQLGDGVISEEAVGGQFVSLYGGNGSIENLTGARFSTYNGIGVVPNSGDVDSLRGINTTTVHGSTGTTSFAYGIATNLRIENAGGLIGNAYGNDVKIIAEAGQIQQATNIKLNSLIDTGTIDNATGIEFNAGTYDGDIPGLFSTGNTIGISFQDYVAEGALEGDNVYGIYFNDVGSLQGTTSEYALYIGDTDAENWFSNGLRIGVNNDTYKIDDDNDNGAASSSPLYIGNEVIDTSVSDRRLKKNISIAETSALEFIDQFDVVQFDWLTRNDRSEYGTVPFGLIAQDVADMAPVYARIPTDPDNYYSVRFGDMVPMTIKAIQEMNLKISDIQNFEDETVLSHLRNWLASATNGIERIFAGRVETNEIQTDQLCVGSRCISESEFIELLDRNSVSGTPATGDSDEIDSGIEEEITESQSENGDLLEEGSGTSSEEGVIEIESEDSVLLELVEEESDTSPESDAGGDDSGTEGGETPII